MLVGATLGSRYWVLSVIGRGGMSVVYKAKVKDTGKIVAVKTLRTQGMTDEMVVKRFQREAELLSRLNHPRIVNLHAYGSSQKGQPFFVMDYLIGENLTDLLKREDHLNPERFQDVFVQVCAAIEHAHRQGAIHRDIKPGNIMLTRQGGTNDYVKVVDFGIAKMAEEAQRLTRMGEVWGSPIYMSPEQCMGATVDERSDIYSLGIVMYESLTGKVPFLGKNYADTMTKQISDNPAPFAQIRPDLTIPASLEKIIFTAMAKAPEDRYQTLNTMRKDIEGALRAGSANDSNFTSTTKARASFTDLKKPEESKKQDSKKVEPKKAEAPKKPEPRKGEVRKTDSRDLQGRDTNNKLRKLGPQKKTAPPPAKPVKKIDQRKRTTKSLHRPAIEGEQSSRGKQLIIVALASLIFSLSLIAIMSNGEAISQFLATMVKGLVSGLDDGSNPYTDLHTDQNDGSGTNTGSGSASGPNGGGQEQKQPPLRGDDLPPPVQVEPSR